MNNIKNSVAGVTSPLWARAIKISIKTKELYSRVKRKSRFLKHKSLQTDKKN